VDDVSRKGRDTTSTRGVKVDAWSGAVCKRDQIAHVVAMDRCGVPNLARGDDDGLSAVRGEGDGVLRIKPSKEQVKKVARGGLGVRER
jgi:hypothetical protein